MSWDKQQSLLQNVAAISGDFHTHIAYWDFYDTFGKHTDGFMGIYNLCVDMAKALTDFEDQNGQASAYDDTGAPWIEIVEGYVDAVIWHALQKGEIPNVIWVLKNFKIKEENNVQSK